jgi:hypothetical protein
MERQFIHSSLINTVGYDPATETLEVEFSDAHITQYLNVSAHIYSKLMSATSHGRYFLAHIRNKHTSRKIQAKATQ